jgi:hypothetical protein
MTMTARALCSATPVERECSVEPEWRFGLFFSARAPTLLGTEMAKATTELQSRAKALKFLAQVSCLCGPFHCSVCVGPEEVSLFTVCRSCQTTGRINIFKSDARGRLLKEQPDGDQ